jgi:tetratricopeptide (TPR) repeat protein
MIEGGTTSEPRRFFIFHPSTAQGQTIPMLPRRRISHAQGYLALGMAAEAEAELDRIEGPDASLPEVTALRLAALHEQEKWPEVRALAATMVKRSPDEAGLWVTWAYATRRAESLAAAESILREAEQLHPADATIQFNLGCYACQRGELAAARARVDRAIALDRKYADLAATDPDLAALRE